MINEKKVFDELISITNNAEIIFHQNMTDSILILCDNKYDTLFINKLKEMFADAQIIATYERATKEQFTDACVIIANLTE
jgi:hypothetical protein